MMRGRQAGIAAADDDDVGLCVAREPGKAGNGSAVSAQSEAAGARRPDLCHVSRPARLSSARGVGERLQGREMVIGPCQRGTAGVPPKPFWPWRRSIQQAL